MSTWTESRRCLSVCQATLKQWLMLEGEYKTPAPLSLVRTFWGIIYTLRISFWNKLKLPKFAHSISFSILSCFLQFFNSFSWRYFLNNSLVRYCLSLDLLLRNPTLKETPYNSITNPLPIPPVFHYRIHGPLPGKYTWEREKTRFLRDFENFVFWFFFFFFFNSWGDILNFVQLKILNEKFLHTVASIENLEDVAILGSNSFPPPRPTEVEEPAASVGSSLCPVPRAALAFRVLEARHL